MRKYLYRMLARYVRMYARPADKALEVDPISADLAEAMEGIGKVSTAGLGSGELEGADYLVFNGNLHYEQDVQEYLARIRPHVPARSRLLIVTYNALWRPLIQAATTLGMRRKTLESNWLADADIENFLELTDFELVRKDSRILIPFYIPLLSALANRYLAPLPLLRFFSLVNVYVARPVSQAPDWRPSVSIVVAARNEAGNIDNIIDRVKPLGPDDELIFVEGGSSDDTWERLLAAQAAHSDRNIVVAKQDGKGKGDAVRKGFSLASKDILMILDADLTVPPEDLPKFYDAIASGKAEFINGSRLVYPMEKEAMRFLNMLGNRFFAAAFSFVLGQRFKDTLCGTKVLTRDNYIRLAANRSYFGEFDPFGDFDLIFGATRMGLKVIEVPIRYRERTYGETNISRWRHGALLLVMLVFASRKLKFI
ncbi:glycosyltransferase family 2 protein [Pseudoxanthomonas suwonensis]|uniref:Glycosyl transferase n=1 Tax=Pseudoxanthomonas suwonensis TaxID=314722 RepID=A0A0E3Z2B2_9GAMM|nr:glycosyltransferase family 2 protein [Pseudoxanthomonas suwonensis]AKC87222.1 glycosyl transferase [Pseudoxanthomonas suwonensis]